MNKKNETTLLDSSLNTVELGSTINHVSQLNYTVKIIDCKDFKQIYVFDKTKVKDIDKVQNNLRVKKPKESEEESSSVEFKNVMRSKINLQRLAKCNADVWKTFITLTFKTHVTELDEAYKSLRKCIISIQRVFPDFKYLIVPEYQKSGRVHYHCITNIDLDQEEIIKVQKRKDKQYYHVKQWFNKYGFDKVEPVKDKDGNDIKKICGYISKYMSKGYIDDSFFNHNRYYSSQNLDKPKEYLIDLKSEEGFREFNNIIKDSSMIFDKTYTDKYDNNIAFLEYKTNE